MLDSFFLFGDVPHTAEHGTYNFLRVVLSYCVATFASYTTLALAHEMVAAKTALEKRALHWGGALAMGVGIWAMHFIGMLSHRLPFAVAYDPSLTVLSLLIAIGVAYGLFLIIGRERLETSQTFIGGTLLGLGISGMHYTGMAAMKMDAALRYLPGIFFLSIAVGIAASCVGLWLAFTLARHHSPNRFLYKSGAALVIGGAICGMHYTGMMASVFLPFPQTRLDAYQNSDTLAGVTVGASAFILLIALGVVTYRSARSDSQLRDSESKLRAVIDNALDALITINQQGVVESFNAAAERLFGYQAGEVIGQNIRMLMPEPYQSEHDGYLRHYLTTGEARVIGTAGREVMARRKDGSTFPIDLSVSAFRLTDGRHFAGIIRDITARKDNEERLKESQQRASLVIKCALDAIVTIDDQGKITEWNEQAERVFGWPRTAAMGQLMAELIIPPAQRSAHHAGLQRFLQDGTANILGRRLEMTALHRSGFAFAVEMAITSQKVQDRVHFTAFLRNIALQKKAEAERDAMIRSLELSNRELDEFAYIVSHDLKEPLRGLRNQATFLIEDFGDRIEEGLPRMQRMITLADRMQRLVDDLLFYSRLGRSEMALQPANLNDVVREIVEMLESLIDERRVRITVPQPLPTIICDKTRVTEAFRNLITNAIKYNDNAQPHVEIGCIQEMATASGPEKQVFYVKDNGAGIAPEFHDVIFLMFKRLHNNGTDDQAGTGAGLTFAKKIIEGHGGRIWLDSETGAGACFYFTLPPPVTTGKDDDAEVAIRSGVAA
jgi:two-component system, LuxR family, sensor kinase FixL